MSADRAALDAKIQEVATRNENVIADFQKKVKDLQDKLDAGATLDFQAEVDVLQGVLDKANAADPVPETPAV